MNYAQILAQIQSGSVVYNKCIAKQIGKLIGVLFVDIVVGDKQRTNKENILWTPRHLTLDQSLHIFLGLFSTEYGKYGIAYV